MRRFILILAMIATSIPVRADERPTFDALWAHANADPAHKTRDGGIAIVVEVPSEGAVYYFTKPGEPIHPGVVRRTFEKRGDAIYAVIKGWSFAPDNAQEPFRRWLEAFKAQTKDIRQKMEETFEAQTKDRQEKTHSQQGQ